MLTWIRHTDARITRWLPCVCVCVRCVCVCVLAVCVLTWHRHTGARITRWLPPNEAAGDGALYHVVHDDGDEEDVDEQEAEAALDMCADRYRSIDPSINQSICTRNTNWVYSYVV